MIKSKKIYAKALDKYSLGYIDDALRLCEESISMDVNNAPAINLKGLLYYLKGDLTSAQNLWKMNLKLNKDKISEKYLKDSKEDINRIKLYDRAVELLNELRVKEAIELLNRCKESDFNLINVNNQLAICYIKKLQYNLAERYIDNVLKVDRKNKIALINKKTLIDNGIIKGKAPYKKIISIIVVICIIATLGGLSKKYVKNYAGNFKIKKSKQVAKNNNLNKKQQPKDKISDDKKEKKENFEENLKKHVKDKDMELLYNDIKYGEKNSLNDNEKIFLGKAKELMKSDGVDYFYNLSNKLVEKKDYKNAMTCLFKAYEYSKDSWQYPHIVYMIGVCNQNLGNLTDAIKYYKIYDKTGDKNYEDVVLYNLALLYKNIDKEKSINYAERLTYDFSQSMYNNSNIKRILETN